VGGFRPETNLPRSGLTKVVANLDFTTPVLGTVPKHAVVDAIVGSEGDGLDDGRRDDGYQQQDERGEQQHRQRGRGTQHDETSAPAIEQNDRVCARRDAAVGEEGRVACRNRELSAARTGKGERGGLDW
jgi:hypothetical protein